jgi:hypothetical protein
MKVTSFIIRFNAASEELVGIADSHKHADDLLSSKLHMWIQAVTYRGASEIEKVCQNLQGAENKWIDLLKKVEEFANHYLKIFNEDVIKDPQTHIAFIDPVLEREITWERSIHEAAYKRFGGMSPIDKEPMETSPKDHLFAKGVISWVKRYLESCVGKDTASEGTIRAGTAYRLALTQQMQAVPRIIAEYSLTPPTHPNYLVHQEQLKLFFEQSAEEVVQELKKHKEDSQVLEKYTIVLDQAYKQKERGAEKAKEFLTHAFENIETLEKEAERTKKEGEQQIADHEKESTARLEEAERLLQEQRGQFENGTIELTEGMGRLMEVNRVSLRTSESHFRTTNSVQEEQIAHMHKMLVREQQTTSQLNREIAHTENLYEKQQHTHSELLQRQIQNNQTIEQMGKRIQRQAEEIQHLQSNVDAFEAYERESNCRIL